MIYRLYKTLDSEIVDAAMTIDSVPGWSFLLNPEQPLYQQFKQDVLEGAELQDADGVLMTSDEAKAYVATLP